MWPYPKVLAHRGAGVLAPENTLAAMQHGLSYGFRAVEFDVMLSKDHVPILMHDEYFGRTIAGKGAVADCNAQELFNMDVGSWFDPRFRGEPPPSFESVIRFCREHGIWMNIEIKPASGFEVATGRIVAETVGRHFLAELAAGRTDPLFGGHIPLLSSFSFAALDAAQSAVSELPRGLLAIRRPEDWLEQCRAIDAVSMHLSQQYLRVEEIAQIKQHGLGVLSYTVNDIKRAREILDMGVDAFCTDRIDLIAFDFAKDWTP